MRSLRPNVRVELDSLLEKSAFKIIGSFHVKDLNDEDSENTKQWLLMKHLARNKTTSYFIELTNSYRKAEYCYEKMMLFASEVIDKFGENYSEEVFKNDRYLFSILFEIKINLEMSVIYAFSSWNKLLQLLNIYYNLGIKENDVDNRGLVEEKINLKKQSFSKYNIDTYLLNRLLNLKGRSIKGISIFGDSKEIRESILHRINALNKLKYINYNTFMPYYRQVEHLLYLNCEAINILFEIIIKNKYNISYLYR